MLARQVPKLQPGRDPSRAWRQTRLLHLGDRLRETVVGELANLLRPGDTLVLNDAATLPASLEGTLRGERIEVRLASAHHGRESFPQRWTVVLFGEGDWRTATEERAVPPCARVGDLLKLGPTLRATVETRHAVSRRLLDIRFETSGDELAESLYALGAPVQYSHLEQTLRLSDVQTPYASRAWAMEMPSTGRPLHWPLLDALRGRGIELAWLTHAAGLSATGDAALDASLPLPERYEIPASTVRIIESTQVRGGRVVAAGTTVVRALESAWSTDESRLRAGRGIARIRLGCLKSDDRCAPKVVDGILTGIHSPGESHFELLEAFASPHRLRIAHRFAAERGYLAHELGDLMLIL